VVDAVHILAQLCDGADAADQIAFSDHIVLNKVDDARVPVGDIEARLRGLNPFAPITRANRCDVRADEVLNRHGFDLDRVEAQLPTDEGEHRHGHIDSRHIDSRHIDSRHIDSRHIDSRGIASVSLTCDAPLDASRLEDWLRELLARQGNDILRTKGILSVADQDRKLVVQAVNMMLEGDYTGEWGDGARISRLVFIGRNLNYDDLKSGFRRCRQGVAHYAE
jgi:G3E family GTPase